MSCRVAGSNRRGAPAFSPGQHAPQLAIGEHELSFEDHELLEPAAVDARVEHTPAFDRARTHEHHRRRERSVDRRRRRDPRLTSPRPGVGVDGEDLDALDDHQALAIVVWARLDARIRPIASRHRQIDCVVDVPFDDEEPGEAARHLIVRGSVGVRVIPVRAGWVRLRRSAGPPARPLHVTQLMFVLRVGDALVRRQRRHAGIGRRLAGPPVGMRQDRAERCCRRPCHSALKPGSTCKPCVCRFVVCDPCGTLT